MKILLQGIYQLVIETKSNWDKISLGLYLVHIWFLTWCMLGFLISLCLVYYWCILTWSLLFGSYLVHLIPHLVPQSVLGLVPHFHHTWFILWIIFATKQVAEIVTSCLTITRYVLMLWSASGKYPLTTYVLKCEYRKAQYFKKRGKLSVFRYKNGK